MPKCVRQCQMYVHLFSTGNLQDEWGKSLLFDELKDHRPI
jgi:hypothetical protein